MKNQILFFGLITCVFCKSKNEGVLQLCEKAQGFTF